MSRFPFSSVREVCGVAVLIGMASVASAVSVPIVLNIDNSQSSMDIDVTVEVSVFSDSDSDSSTISGTMMADLSIDPSGGTPLIESMEFAGPVTGNRFVIDETLEYHFSLGFWPITQNIDATGTNLAGYTDTPAPPAPVSSQGAGDLSYEFDTAHHEYTLNEGTLAWTGDQSGSMDLATDPAGGSPPTGTMGTIVLTQGDTNGNLTDFTALIDMPIEFTDSSTDDESGVTATWNVNGRVVGMGSFSIDIGLGGTPGDFDDDGDVDGADFLMWQEGLGTTYNATDLANWQENYGSVESAASAVSAVPEPATCWLAAVILGFAASRARQRRSG